MYIKPAYPTTRRIPHPPIREAMLDQFPQQRFGLLDTPGSRGRPLPQTHPHAIDREAVVVLFSRDDANLLAGHRYPKNYGIIGLSCLPNATFHDLYNLVRQKSRESDALRKRIIAAARNDTVR